MVFCLHVPLKRKDMLVESCFFFSCEMMGCSHPFALQMRLVQLLWFQAFSWWIFLGASENVEFLVIFSDPGCRAFSFFFSDGRWTIWWMSSLKLSPPWLQLHYLRISVLILGWDSQVAAKIVVGKGVGKQMTRSRWLQKEAAFLKVLIPWIWGAKALMGLLVWF